MRVRKKPWAEDELLMNPFIVSNPEWYQGKWQEYFGNDNPVYIELGCGKGGFIAESAAQNTDINYIAVELQLSCVAQSSRRVREHYAHLKNIAFIYRSAEFVDALFAPFEISRIYINFCDPWHKKRTAKRRLTHRLFLEKYQSILKEDGSIFFKTDNIPLFDFSVEELMASGWKLSHVSRDLHSEEGFKSVQQLMTEYEARFFENHVAVCYLEATYG